MNNTHNMTCTSVFSLAAGLYLSEGDGLHPFSSVDIEHVHPILTVHTQVERVRACRERERQDLYIIAGSI